MVEMCPYSTIKMWLREGLGMGECMECGCTQGRVEMTFPRGHRCKKEGGPLVHKRKLGDKSKSRITFTISSKFALLRTKWIFVYVFLLFEDSWGV